MHYHIDEHFLVQRGRVNYWGYNTLGFLAPDPRYAASGPEGAVAGVPGDGARAARRGHRGHPRRRLQPHRRRQRARPDALAAGIDNAAYYRLADDRARYVDFTGCGNSLNVAHPRTLQLIMDSLRHWVLEMHVDGFRFDLASALARELWEVDRLGAFFDIIHQDPVLSEVKLIAEPWDLGPNGYQVGNFPVLWTEWNGKYRDCVRRFWKGSGGTVSELASRLAGSSDLYAHNGRRPSASLNFITAHDGFTLRDLVSYNHKHNEANGEENRDGCNDNDSWNCGAEGPTDDAAINTLRARQQRNFLATLLLSQGVPMLLAGDEFGQTQHGNNNAYCQDSPLAWLDWKLSDEQRALLDFTRELLRLRKTQPVFRRRHFFQGRADSRRGHQRPLLDQTRRHRDDRCRLERRPRALPRHGSARRSDHRDGRARRTHRRRHVRHSFQCAPRADRISASARAGAMCAGRASSTPPRPTPQPRTFEHMSVFPLQARSLAVLRAEIIPTQPRT